MIGPDRWSEGLMIESLVGGANKEEEETIYTRRHAKAATTM